MQAETRVSAVSPTVEAYEGPRLSDSDRAGPALRSVAGTHCLSDGRRFEGVFAIDYPTLGAYMDERGAQFKVEMQDKTYFSQVPQLGDAAFKSKAPLQAIAPAPGLQRVWPVSRWAAD